MQHEYFGPEGRRSTKELTDVAAAIQIGERVIVGFNMVHRYVEAPDGSDTSVVYFQSEVTGGVWALYF